MKIRFLTMCLVVGCIGFGSPAQAVSISGCVERFWEEFSPNGMVRVGFKIVGQTNGVQIDLPRPKFQRKEIWISPNILERFRIILMRVSAAQAAGRKVSFHYDKRNNQIFRVDTYNSKC